MDKHFSTTFSSPSTHTRRGPLSYGQRAFWFSWRLDPHSPHYNISFVFRLKMLLDEVGIQEALKGLIARHAIFRTTYEELDGIPQQIVHDQPDPSFQKRMTADCNDIELQHLLLEEAHRPFDLCHGPVLRVTLWHTTAQGQLLQFTYHHICTDGYNLPHLFQDFASFYTAWQQGTTPDLPALPAQYLDFASWQERMLASEDGERMWQYWRTQLQAPLPVLQLQTDHPRPAIQTYVGATLPFQLQASLTQQLRQFARQEQMSLSTPLLTAFFLLLHRYSQQEDIIIGFARLGRTHPTFEEIVGYFTNFCPIRARLTSSMSARQALQRLKHHLRQSRDHQAFPLPLLVERLRPPRDPSISPLFQAAFVYQKTRLAGYEGLIIGQNAGYGDLPFQIGDLPMELYWLPNPTSQFDLHLSIEEIDGVLSAGLQYNTDLFESSTIERLAAHYQQLIHSLLREPEQSIALLPLLSPEEQHQLLVTWNTQTRAVTTFSCIHELFEQQAARTPHALALLFGAQRMTYQELNRQANRLAQQLLQMGVQPEQHIALFLERSLELMVGILGILKAGGAYVHLDPSLPQARLTFLLEDCEADLVLTRPYLQPRLQSTALPLVYLDPVETLLPMECDINPELNGEGHHLAYIIYTSGSTGKPKGVMVEHQSLAHFIAAWLPHLNLQVQSRVLQFATCSFDASVGEIFPTLLAGATLVIASEEEKYPGPQLVQLCHEHGVTHAMLPPSVLALLAPEEIPSLEVVISAGEACPPEVIARWRSGRRFLNAYGPTETTVIVVVADCQQTKGRPPIGRPLEHAQLYVLDSRLQPVPTGVPGELYIGGVGVTRGYWKRPDLTAERFIPDPFVGAVSGTCPQSGARLYRTGDLVRTLPDGQIDYLGRIDQQVKLRGFRIELEEVTTVLRQHPLIKDGVVLLRENHSGEKRLVAYVVPQSAAVSPLILHHFLQEQIPEYMIPSAFFMLDALPLNANGKIDRHALLALDIPVSREKSEPLATLNPMERQIAQIWQDLLGTSSLSHESHFFECGGHSLLAVQACAKLSQQLGFPISVITLFQHPHLSAFALSLRNQLDQASPSSQSNRQEHLRHSQSNGTLACPVAFAIIGMAGRFPGANSVDALWENLVQGIEAIQTLSEEELLAAGVDPTLISQTGYVKRGAFLDGVEDFDAAFFGYTPGDAALLDPQQRLFLECAWHALEHAGYSAPHFSGRIGVFGGTGPTSYWFSHLLPHSHDSSGVMANYPLMISNDKDFLATRVCYKLGLTGPGITVQTACSTSLVAVALACQQLRDRQCDLALAGGVSLALPHKTGYLYQEGGLFSPDGHCRAFDAQAQGTVRGSGGAIVVLKRLDEAIADGDHIWAVIKGWGVNNDGQDKASFTAPSMAGQAQAIQEAQEMAQVSAREIGYVETHGTGTSLGDPIEIAALTQAFRQSTQENGFCAIGSLKTNLGHLEAAAGVTGLIKTALLLHHQQIPPSLHFTRPNPHIPFSESPFFVNTKLSHWEQGHLPRRAGVSSFGVGGTNAHVILEEAPTRGSSSAGSPVQLLPVSAKSINSLKQLCDQVYQYVEEHPHTNLADLAYTLQVGRQALPYRRVLLARQERTGTRVISHLDSSLPEGWVKTLPKLVFVFPGLGTIYHTECTQLYRQEAVFRQALQHCADLFQEQLDYNLLDFLLAASSNESNGNQIQSPLKEHPILFSFQYALATWWQSLGLHPDALLGYSFGEYVAACLAGVFSLADAVKLVAQRAILMSDLPQGAMIAVNCSEAEAVPFLNDELSLAVVSHPTRCVLAGSRGAIQKMEEYCCSRSIAFRQLPGTLAFHSPMMDSILSPFASLVESISLHEPTLPLLSNVTGTWMMAEQATDPHYWVRHLRRTVRFADGLAQCLTEGSVVFLEMGPERILSSLILSHPKRTPQHQAFSSLVHRAPSSSDLVEVMTTLGRLWVAGAPVSLPALHEQEKRHRHPLPLYPFERQRYWIEPAQSTPIQEQLPCSLPTEEPDQQEDRKIRDDVHAPVNETQSKVMESFFHVLGYQPQSIHANFFSLGGDSLSALSLLRHLEQAFQRSRDTIPLSV